MIEHRFQCPCCWEEISMVLEPSEEEVSYVEDCEVCCRPLLIRYRSEEGGGPSEATEGSGFQVLGFGVEAS
jgi:hypothetical protein